jgi:hypothetical protein
MKKIVTRVLASLTFLGGLALVPAPASALSGPGAALKGAYAGNQGCFNTVSYGAIQNNCSTPQLLIGTLAVSPNAWHTTSVSLYGDNSNCQVVTTNGVGNGSYLGPVTYAVSGPQTWQTLNTGSVYVWDVTSALTLRCVLEPGGEIGSFTAD